MAVSTLNLDAALGTIQVLDRHTDPVAVVGVFDATGPLANLANTALVQSDPTYLETLWFVYAMASAVSTVDHLENTLRTSTPAMNPAALTVEAPSGAIALREVIAGRLGAASRNSWPS